MATKTRQLADFLVAGGVSDAEIQSVPHIRPGILQPAVAGKLLDGTTNHSGNYGTAQSDGHSYYYTDIKGSRAIKDPRIGAYFGSQRHRASSLIYLDQESHSHGAAVYSVDGKEWFRAVGDQVTQTNNAWQGNFIGLNSDDNFWEVTFYGIDLNWCMGNHSANRGFMITVDGGTESAEKNPAETTQSGDYTPNRNRYQDSGFLVNIGVGASLGIHTVKIRPHTSGTNQVDCSFMEIITQDTSSVANRSKIQIPAQNVVSYGKKFSVSAATPHYDPFNGFTSGASVSSYVDTATSLGVEGWKNGSTYYRPYNGGRVVKWIANDGTIKTSVTMMPPNARSIGNSASLTNATAKANASIANNTFYPTFEAGAIDHSLAEVAKTFHWRQFGNGSANAGLTAGGSLSDASKLHSPDDFAYGMEDGLTTCSGDDCNGNSANRDLQPESNGDRYYYTFIGTGVGIESTQDTAGYHTFAQNLPYGTHILTVKRDSTHKVYLDGIEIKSGTLYSTKWITFYQPKKPPVPEDACIIADYMLMADYVKQTAIDNGVISKGVRFVSGGREHKYDTSGSTMSSVFDPANCHWGHGVGSGGAACTSVIPFFGTTGQGCAEGVETADWTLQLGGSTVTHAELQGGSGFGGCDQMTTSSTVDLGLTTIGSTFPSGGHQSYGHLVVTPTHTSHHYQQYETQFLYELLGGDRNMEQTNLVVTADGKTWDEVTRDKSYIGNNVVAANIDATNTGHSIAVWDNHRGVGFADSEDTHNHLGEKDFAIEALGWTCLKTGYYMIYLQSLGDSANVYLELEVNGNGQILHKCDTANESHELTWYAYLKRGDYLQTKAQLENTSYQYTQFKITRGN